MKPTHAKYLIAILVTVLLWSCSTTRRIDEGEILYCGVDKVNIIPDSGERVSAGVRSALKEAVDVPPNNYWKLVGWHYPFPLGLWVYNNWPRAESGFKHWIYEKLVEDPVLISDVRPELRTQMVEQILHNSGYFRGKAHYTMLPKKNPRKASVTYDITTGPAFTFNDIETPPDTSQMTHIVDSIARSIPYLQSGQIYNTDSLSMVRNIIADGLRNKGFYYFRPEFIEYLADTVSVRGKVNLRIVPAANIPIPLMQAYRTGDVRVIVYPNRGAKYADTIPLKDLTLIQVQPSKLRPSVIEENVTIRPGRIFSVRNMDRTQSYLARLGIFKSINIEPKPDTTAIASEPTLNVDISCTLDMPLEASIEVNASSKSNSYIGPGVVLGLTHRNMFGGGEQFNASLTGTYEWQTGKKNSGGIFNSYEIGLTTSLSFPRLLAPKFVRRRRRQINWTRFSLNGDLLNRPHYFRMGQLNASMSYEWLSSRYINLSYTPLKLTYTKLMKTTEEFDKIMEENPAVAQSFRSQFVPQMMFGINYDRYYDSDNRLTWSLDLQEGGNILWGAYSLCGAKGEKKLFGTPFSQFVKGQTQLVYSHRLGRGDHWLVMRGAVGAAHAYGNSSQVPYAEQFYCGGANSVRAFTIRMLGPGSYRAPEDTPGQYFDQTGTFKFEANVEYRFPIYGPVHGALFLDSGNIWLLKSDPQRPGGVLSAKNFLRDLALGTGVGIRLDISMLVVRLDWGYALHAPYNTGYSGYFNMHRFKDAYALHLAIGYPF